MSSRKITKTRVIRLARGFSTKGGQFKARARKRITGRKIKKSKEAREGWSGTMKTDPLSHLYHQ